jgi:hypothetical protein
MVLPSVEGIDLFSALSGRSMRGVGEEPQDGHDPSSPQLENFSSLNTPTTTLQTTLSCLDVHTVMELCSS